MNIDNLESLKLAFAVQPRELLFFWGHTGRSGQVGKECLCQWYPAAFEVDGIRYPTSEHFMMAEKARLFGDSVTLAAILAADHPGSAKNLGRQVRGFDEQRWQEARYDIVVRGSIEKFGQNPAPLDFLMRTNDKILVEASPEDWIWGIGLSEWDEAAKDPYRWKGLNLLGFALMTARERLRQAGAGGHPMAVRSEA